MFKTNSRWFAGAVVLLAAGTIGTVAFRAGAEEPQLVPAVTPPAAETPTGQDKTETVATENFVVEGVPPRLARHIAEQAEAHRKKYAELWLGKELAKWPEPARIRVRLEGKESASGTTALTFLEKRVVIQSVVAGTLDRILTDALPHEVTHMVIAAYFGKPVPRWADEGIALMSESPEEQARHEKGARELIDNGRAVGVGKLLALKDYPRDIMVVYAQGFSVARFLAARKDRSTLLAFVKDGMAGDDWDKAAKEHYGFKDADELGQAWLDDLRVARATDPAPPRAVADAAKEVPAAPAPEAGSAVMRQGQVVISRPYTVAEPTTSYRLVEEKGEKYYQPVTTYKLAVKVRETSYDPKALKAYETDGAEVAPARLAERLKERTPVLVSSGVKVDAFYLQVIKPGTLILVEPPPAPVVAGPSSPVVPRQGIPPTARP